MKPFSFKHLGRNRLSLILGICYAISFTSPLILALAFGSILNISVITNILIALFLLAHVLISIGLILRTEGAWLPAVTLLCVALAIKLFTLITAKNDVDTTGAMVLLFFAVIWDLIVGSLLLVKGRALYPVLIPGKLAAKLLQ